MSDDRQARLESHVAALALALKQLSAGLEAVNANQILISQAIDRLNRRLLMQEAVTAMYEIQTDRSLQ